MTDVTDGDDTPVTFVAFAERIKKSRPYVSKLVINGTIHGAALVPDGKNRKIIPSVALAQMAAAADPGRTTNGQPADPSPTHNPAYGSARTRKIEADAQAAELDLQIRRGAYIERRTAGPAIAGFFRELRDAIILAIREQPDRAEDAVTAVFADKAAKLPHVLTAGDPAPG